MIAQAVERVGIHDPLQDSSYNITMNARWNWIIGVAVLLALALTLLPLFRPKTGYDFLAGQTPIPVRGKPKDMRGFQFDYSYAVYSFRADYTQLVKAATKELAAHNFSLGASDQMFTTLIDEATKREVTILNNVKTAELSTTSLSKLGEDVSPGWVTVFAPTLQ